MKLQVHLTKVFVQRNFSFAVSQHQNVNFTHKRKRYLPLNMISKERRKLDQWTTLLACYPGQTVKSSSMH